MIFYLLVELLKYSHCFYSEVVHNEGLMQINYFFKNKSRCLYCCHFDDIFVCDLMSLKADLRTWAYIFSAVVQEEDLVHAIIYIYFKVKMVDWHNSYLPITIGHTYHLFIDIRYIANINFGTISTIAVTLNQ